MAVALINYGIAFLQISRDIWKQLKTMIIIAIGTNFFFFFFFDCFLRKQNINIIHKKLQHNNDIKI